MTADSAVLGNEKTDAGDLRAEMERLGRAARAAAAELAHAVQ